MNVIRTRPSEQLKKLGNTPPHFEVEQIALGWLETPEELYGLPEVERFMLRQALQIAGLDHIETALRNAVKEVHERQPSVIEAKARVDAAINDPQGLFELPEGDWQTLLETAGRNLGYAAHNMLMNVRRQFRDNQPHILEAHSLVVAAIADPARLLSLRPKEWSQLLKTADLVPRDFQGQYRNFRTKLTRAKTAAVVASRIAAIPSSSVKHLGISGALDLAFVRKVDAVINTRWTTVPRLGVDHRNRNEMRYEKGGPVAQILRCDAQQGDFHGVPAGLDRGSTSIICEDRDAATLKLFGLTVFEVNVSPELEAYFRSLGSFPWESPADGEAA